MELAKAIEKEIREGQIMISIIIPCYNEQLVLQNLYHRVTQAANKFHDEWEVIAVNDGSKDETLKILKQLNMEDNRWKIVSFARNFGHQTAVSAGIRYAAGDCVIIMDADLQDPPEILDQFIEKWQQGFEVVYAIRKKRKESIAKRLCYYVFYRILRKLSNIDIPLDSGDFCLMDRRIVNILNSMPERNRFIRGMRAWAGFRHIGIEYERHSRAAGEPQYTLSKLVKLAFDGVFSFSISPLHYILFSGLTISTLSFLIGIFTFIQRIFTSFFSEIGLEPVPGYATTIIGIFFLGGIQLICIGVIGEYIGRIYDEVRRRPLWVVKETTGIDDSQIL